VWKWARDLATACRAAGQTVPATDILVYACARVHGVDIEEADRHFATIRVVESREPG
jgi:predicted nucleic acid-binding protein